MVGGKPALLTGFLLWTADRGVPLCFSQIVLLDVAQLRLRRPIRDKPSGHLRFSVLATKLGEKGGRGGGGMSIRRLVGSLLLALTVALAGWGGPTDEGGVPSESESATPALNALRLGYGAMENGEYEAALTHYGAALDKAGTSELRFQSLFGLGSAAAALGRPGEAETYFSQAHELRPGNAEVLHSLGLTMREQGRLEEAASRFAEAAVREPTLQVALVELGVTYEMLERHDAAADACWRAVALAPDDQPALLCLAVARYHGGDYPGAAQAFSAVIELDPNHARAHYGLGLAMLYGEDLEGADAEYWILRELDPELAKDLFGRIYPPED
jgi:tetratricopeptide (TPR) repeat protein